MLNSMDWVFLDFVFRILFMSKISFNILVNLELVLIFFRVFFVVIKF